MPSVRPQQISEPSAVAKAFTLLKKAAPTRQRCAYLFVGSGPIFIGCGVGIETGVGWGLVAGGVGVLLVGWLLGAE